MVEYESLANLLHLRPEEEIKLAHEAEEVFPTCDNNEGYKQHFLKPLQAIYRVMQKIAKKVTMLMKDQFRMSKKQER
jgi:hypothetical protein